MKSTRLEIEAIVIAYRMAGQIIKRINYKLYYSAFGKYRLSNREKSTLKKHKPKIVKRRAGC